MKAPSVTPARPRASSIAGPVLLVLALLAAPGARGGVITDLRDFTGLNPLGHLVSAASPTFSYVHDVTDDGFAPGTSRLVGAVLLIEVRDDLRDLFEPTLSLADPPEEWVTVTVDLLFPLNVGLPIPVNNDDPATAAREDVITLPFGTLSLQLGLGLDGRVLVTLRSADVGGAGVGDFYVRRSLLAAIVPEPGTLGLVAIALLGLLGGGRPRAGGPTPRPGAESARRAG